MYELLGSQTLMPYDTSKGRSPMGGKTYFVNNDTNIGSDSHEGNDPEFPLLTIAAAYAKCENQRNDYIFVQRHSTLPAAITFGGDPSDVHLVSLGSGNWDNGIDLYIEGATPIILSGCVDIELAGFNIVTNDDSHPAISIVTSAYRVHIHHCGFGTIYACGGGISGAEFTHSSIDHCIFGTLLEGTAIASEFITSMCLNNLFHTVAGTLGIVHPGVNPCHYSFFLNNMFYVPDSANGEAITLRAGSVHNVIANNQAMNGNALTDYATNPYRDLNGGNNHWGMNYRGSAVIEPITV